MEPIRENRGQDAHALIESHRNYAHALTAEILRKLPPEVEKKELESAAELGLVEAAGAFDAARGVQFKTFAYYRIRGAIYDCLRKMGWFSKSMYQEFRFQAAANELMKDSAEAQLPAGASHDPENLTGAIVNCYMLSLDASPKEIVDRMAASPEESFSRREQCDRVRAAVAQLPERNRKILEEYYYQDRNLEEIGAGMGLSKSWLCRMHAKSLEMLREILERSPSAVRATQASAVR